MSTNSSSIFYTSNLTLPFTFNSDETGASTAAKLPTTPGAPKKPEKKKTRFFFFFFFFFRGKTHAGGSGFCLVRGPNRWRRVKPRAPRHSGLNGHDFVGRLNKICRQTSSPPPRECGGGRRRWAGRSGRGWAVAVMVWEAGVAGGGPEGGGAGAVAGVWRGGRARG